MRHLNFLLPPQEVSKFSRFFGLESGETLLIMLGIRL